MKQSLLSYVVRSRAVRSLLRRRGRLRRRGPGFPERRVMTLEGLETRVVLSASPLGVPLTASSVEPEFLVTAAPLGGTDEAESFTTTSHGAEGENHDEQHIHARLSIFVNSQQVTIPTNIGVSAQGFLSQIHTHDATGEIHIHPIGSEPRDTTLTLGDFFQVWRTNAGLAGNNPNAIFSSTNLMGNQANTTQTVQMFVNGEISTEFEDYVFQDHDQVVLVYGSNPVVSVNTTFGPIPIELFAEETPITVDNFLNYVNDGDYLNSFFHRSASNFVIQGGGFRTSSLFFSDISQFSAIPTDAPIQNEPGISNLRGTVAMAKLGGDPNSATSQFFVNLSDSNSFLDLPENNAFTVFGQVLDMASVDRIAGLHINTSNPSPYGELPLGDDGMLPVVLSLEGQGRISGTKFQDVNGNGVRDAGEPGIAGATIFLDANNNGVLDPGELSTTTDANGRFLFEVEPGTYTVRAVVGEEQEVTVPTGLSHSATVELGRETSSLNFGVFQDDNGTTIPDAPNSIGGLVYLDQNGNGTRDPGEFGVPGSWITLVGTATNGQSITRSTLTRDDGSYQFLELPSGTYRVIQQQSLALHDGTTATTVSGVVSGENEFSNVVLTGETIFSDLNFGEAGIRAEYISIEWYLSTTPDDVTMMREVMARAASAGGDHALAEAIRQGDTTPPGETPVVPSDPDPDPEPNQAPVAVNDSYSVIVNGELSVSSAEGVLANDSDPDDDPLTAVLVTGTANGTLTLNADGSFTYLPDADFSGTDTFTYRADDGDLTSNLATVTITITAEATNNPPVAQDNSYTVEQDGALVTSSAEGVLENDSDPDGDPLAAELVTDVSQGLLFLNNDGSFTYLPDQGFVGTDTFTYRAFDGQLHSAPATVSITVTPAEQQENEGAETEEEQAHEEEESGEGEANFASLTDQVFAEPEDWWLLF